MTGGTRGEWNENSLPDKRTRHPPACFWAEGNFESVGSSSLCMIIRHDPTASRPCTQFSLISVKRNSPWDDCLSDYLEANQPWPATTRQIAAWAIRQSKWKPQPSALVNQCADQIGRAMREEHFIDAQGRTVRAKHVARVERGGEQIALWTDIRSASSGL